MAKGKKRGKRTAVDGTVWGGSLATPIELERPFYMTGILQTPEDIQRAENDFRQQLLAARSTKMVELFRHFSINPQGEHADIALAYALAVTCVPGFQVAGKPGAPSNRNDIIVCGRVFAYLRAKPTATISAACEVLATRKRLPGDMTPSRARRIYSQSPWRKLLDKAAKYQDWQRANGEFIPENSSLEKFLSEI